MQRLATPLRYIAALLPLTMPLQADAVAVCESPDSDPDRDGWGWESDASCVVDPATIRLPPPVCESEASDPDNDGWGWENDASCKVETGEYPLPGTSITSATNVAVGTEMQATVNDGEEHWYSVDIVDNQFAFVVTAGSGSLTDYTEVLIHDSAGLIPGYVDLIGIDDRSSSLCLSPGRYFISVTPFPEPMGQSLYSLSVNATDLRCVQPEYTIETDDFSSAFATIAGGFVYATSENDLVAMSHDGQTLWEIENVLEYFVNEIVVADDNTIYAYNGDEVASITASGELQWTYRLKNNGYLDNLAADSRGVYLLAGYRDVIGLDLNGTEQWIATGVDGGGALSIRTGDDGTLYLHSYSSVDVLRP